MIRSLARAAALALLAPFLTFASALAPQHVHEPGSSDDHHPAVAHSHFAPHDHAVHHDDATEIEHDDADGQVVWLDSAILHQPVQRLTPATAALVLCRDVVVDPAPRWSVTAVDDAAPPHGPPKVSLLFRGPPSLV
jgi:hypothetical protein